MKSSLYTELTGKSTRIFIIISLYWGWLQCSVGSNRIAADTATPTPNPIPPMERELEKQVFIETKMIEVNFEDKFDLGISWNYTETNPRTNSGFDITDSNVDHSILQTPEGSDIPLGLDITSTIWNLARGDLSVNIQALLTNGNTKLLSNPSITTIEGREAEIVTGEKVPYLTRMVINNQSLLVTEFVETGVILTVKPTILEEDYIELDVTPKVTKVTRYKLEEGNTLPVLSKREARTKVIVKSGEAFVLGGLYQNSTEKV